MTTNFEILSDEWQRLLELAIELPGVRYDGNIKRLGARLINVLRREGWKQFLSTDYDRARSVIEKHYAEKESVVELGESEGFKIGAALTEYSVSVLIKAAQIAHEHRHSPKFLRGLSAGLGGYSASQMAKAAELWPEWFSEVAPRASTVDECRTLFTLASLPNEQAQAAYLYWRDHLNLTFYEMYQYVAEEKAKTRLKDFDRFTHHKRTVTRGTDGMKKTAEAGKQPAIRKIEEILEKEL